MTPNSRNITLTINHETQMNTNPIAACWRILNPFLYLVSSPAAVTIWNPPRSRITNAISANIPNIRLMKLLMTSINLLPWAVPAPATPTLPAEVTSPKLVVTAGVHCAATMLERLTTHQSKKANAFNEIFFIFFIYKQAKKGLSWYHNRFIEYEIKHFSTNLILNHATNIHPVCKLFFSIISLSLFVVSDHAFLYSINSSWKKPSNDYHLACTFIMPMY